VAREWDLNKCEKGFFVNKPKKETGKKKGEENVFK